MFWTLFALLACVQPTLVEISYETDEVNFEEPPYVDWNIINTDSYEIDDELMSHSMEEEEIPEDIKDDDGDIDITKVNIDNGWEFRPFWSSDGCEYDSTDMEIKSVTIYVDDKNFTFELS